MADFSSTLLRAHGGHRSEQSRSGVTSAWTAAPLPTEHGLQKRQTTFTFASHIHPSVRECVLTVPNAHALSHTAQKSNAQLN